MTDKYVIMYRDGKWGSDIEGKRRADRVLRVIKANAYSEETSPAYRIRIREKTIRNIIPALGMSADDAIASGNGAALDYYRVCIADGAYS